MHLRAIRVTFDSKAPKQKKFHVDQCFDDKCEHKQFGKPDQVMRYLMSRPSSKLGLPARLRQDFSRRPIGAPSMSSTSHSRTKSKSKSSKKTLKKKRKSKH